MTYTTLSIREDTKAAFEEIREGTDLSQSDFLDKLVEERQFARLRDDQRIREAREVVAQDHDADPADVSLTCLLKVTCGAYTGFAQTDDWDIQGESHA